MKVLYIDVNCKNSSTGNIVYNLHQQCKLNNIESAVCYGRGPKIKESNIYKFGSDIETCLHAFLTRITGYTGCYSYFSTRRLIKYIKRFKPDVVHIHELHAYFVNIKQLLMYLKKNNVPTVFTNHCEFLYTGKCGHAKSCNKYSENCGHCPLLKEYPKSILFDHTKHMLKVKRKIFEGWDNIFIVSPSNWLNNKINNSFLKNKKRIVIHNGINTEIFNYKGKNNKKKIVLSVAPNIFSTNKGGYKILEIAKQLDNEDIEFVLVGATKPFPIVPKNVKIYGLIDDKQELAKMYSNADCFLILSEYENFPTTCLEAQCCGTKVVGYDVGGVKETTISNCGILVLDYCNDTIIKEIKKCIKERYDKQTISNKACDLHSFNKMFNQYLEIYNTIMIEK